MALTAGRTLPAEMARPAPALGVCRASAPRARAHRAARAPVAAPALRRSAGCDVLHHQHQLSSRLRSHKARLEHLVATGATSAADLAPVVSELR
jgi:hypothetical protein